MRFIISQSSYTPPPYGRDLAVRLKKSPVTRVGRRCVVSEVQASDIPWGLTEHSGWKVGSGRSMIINCFWETVEIAKEKIILISNYITTLCDCHVVTHVPSFLMAGVGVMESFLIVVYSAMNAAYSENKWLGISPKLCQKGKHSPNRNELFSPSIHSYLETQPPTDWYQRNVDSTKIMDGGVHRHWRHRTHVEKCFKISSRIFCFCAASGIRCRVSDYWQKRKKVESFFDLIDIFSSFICMFKSYERRRADLGWNLNLLGWNPDQNFFKKKFHGWLSGCLLLLFFSLSSVCNHHHLIDHPSFIHRRIMAPI